MGQNRGPIGEHHPGPAHHPLAPSTLGQLGSPRERCHRWSSWGARARTDAGIQEGEPGAQGWWGSGMPLRAPDGGGSCLVLSCFLPCVLSLPPPPLASGLTPPSAGNAADGRGVYRPGIPSAFPCPKCHSVSCFPPVPARGRARQTRQAVSPAALPSPGAVPSVEGWPPAIHLLSGTEGPDGVSPRSHGVSRCATTLPHPPPRPERRLAIGCLCWRCRSMAVVLTRPLLPLHPVISPPWPPASRRSPAYM